jgi:hypothetical protein
MPLPADATPDAALHALSGRAAVYATRARGEGTRRAYRSAWRAYAAWCTRLGREPLGADPDTVAMYAVRLADDGRSVATLRVHLAAIQAAHRARRLARCAWCWKALCAAPAFGRAGRPQPPPRIYSEKCWRRGRRPTRRWAPATARCCSASGRRCAAPSWSSCALGDVLAVPGKGLQVSIRRSKTDPHGAGALVAIWANPAEPSCCPLAAWQAWMGFAERRTRAAAPRMRRCRCSSG